jgi:RNA-directed DNA polymerase
MPVEQSGPTCCGVLARQKEYRLGRFPTTENAGSEMPAYMSRSLPQTFSSLRQALGRKAKREPRFRFYSLYDLIYRHDVLQSAWQKVRGNGGAAGPDGVSIDQIEVSEGGPEALLREIAEELRTKSYKPGAVRRVMIPKPDGRQRPLGIPNVRDRIVQGAVYLVLEPIYEEDFLPCSYGFRPGKRAHDALAEIRNHIKRGRRAVYDADLKGFFDSIPHDKLMVGLQQRIADRSVLKLIRMWLKSPIVERKEDGGTVVHRPRAGTPQGGVLSPLLANSFLHWFDRLFHGRKGPAQWAKAKLVRYADDFVVLAYYQGGRLVRWIENTLESRLGLTLNREKTRIVRLDKGESLDFLGYTFQYHRDHHGGSHRYLKPYPSRRALNKERAQLKRMTSKRYVHLPIAKLVAWINRHLRGWVEYFKFGYPKDAYGKLLFYLQERMLWHLKRRSQRHYRLPKGMSMDQLLKRWGMGYMLR